MSRFRIPLLIMGLVGAFVVMVLVVLVVRLGRGTPVALPVAIQDIPPGTPLEPSQFHLEQVRGLRPDTLSAYITAEEFAPYVGRVTLETIHAGSPVLKAQVDAEYQSRLTLTLSDPTHLVYPLPVSADQVGNFIVAGDRVDIIFSLGRVAAQEMVHAYTVPGPPGEVVGVPTPEPLRPGDVITTTLHLPLSKVILPDVLVLRVEREQIRPTTTGYGLSEDQQSTARTVEGDILRLYVEVDREQAEVLSFALNNGTLNLPARAQPAGGTSPGFTWDDFVDYFFRDRPAPWEQ